jgi:hypothetical protein
MQKRRTSNVSRAVAACPHLGEATMPASISPWHEVSRQHGANAAASTGSSINALPGRFRSMGIAALKHDGPEADSDSDPAPMLASHRIVRGCRALQQLRDASRRAPLPKAKR